MILVTGDTHGDLSRFKDPKIRKLKKNDTLIICGDFGFVWNDGKRERRILKKLGRKKYNILFVEGVHENFSLLNAYPAEEWHGGMARTISGNLRQLMRGHVFEIENKTIFAFGGGRSEDNYSYIEGEQDERWAHESLPDEEVDEVVKRLMKHGMKVDYIVSYEPPAKITEFIELKETNNIASDRSHINVFLEKIKDNTEFTMWFFGRHHINKFIPKKYQALFDAVMRLDTLK